MQSATRTAWLIRESGRDVEVAFDGPSAILKARQKKPSLVLLNTELRFMSGIAVCAAIRAMRFGAKPLIVAVSKQAGDIDDDELVAAGFDACLEEPIGNEALTLLLLSSDTGTYHSPRVH